MTKKGLFNGVPATLTYNSSMGLYTVIADKDEKLLASNGNYDTLAKQLKPAPAKVEKSEFADPEPAEDAK